MFFIGATKSKYATGNRTNHSPIQHGTNKKQKSASNSLLFCQEPVKNTRKKSQQKSKQLQPHHVNPEQIVFFKTKKRQKKQQN